MGVRTAAEAGEDPSYEHELGVLFVHGIGRQTRGSTLIGSGEPFHRCVHQRVDGVHAQWGRRGLSHAGVTAWLGHLDDTAEDCDGAVGQLRDSADTAVGDEESDESQRCGAETAANFVRDDPRPLAALAELVTHPRVVENARKPVKIPGSDIEAAPTDALGVRAEFDSASIREGADVGEGAPANATLQLTRVNVDGTTVESSWRLAESWWAPAFDAPTYRELATWSLVVLPWLIGSHFGATVRARVRQLSATSWWGRPTAALRLAAAIVYFMLTPVLILGSILVLLAMWLPAAIPVTRIRSAAAGVQRSIAGTLGDSYVLLRSPIRAAAIRSQVLRDLTWLADKCEKVAVVAHSQGAAVMYQVMRDNVISVDLLVTYGSGLRKLDELEQAQRHRFINGFATATLFGIVATPLGVISLVGGTDTGARLSGLAWGGVGLLALVGSMVDWYRGRRPTKAMLWAAEMKNSGLQWHDIYAVDDPVPNGRLDLGAESEIGYPISHEVHNQDSITKDHTAYWDNTDEFTLSVVDLVARLDPLFADIIAVDTTASDRVRAFRRTRVFLLAALRRFAWVSALVVIIARGSTLGELVEWLLDRLGWRDATIELGDAHAGTLGLLALIGVAYRLVVILWRWWDGRVVRTVIDRLEVDDEMSFGVMLMVMLGLVPPIVAVVTIGWVGLEGDALPVIVTVGMIGVALALVLVPTFQTRRLAGDPPREAAS